MASQPRVETIDLGFRPRRWQAESFKRRKRFNIEVIHRRAGKTVKGIMRLIDAALKCPLPNPRFAYIAPFRDQAKAIAWEYLKGYTQALPGVQKNEGELWVQLPGNNARIRLFGADNADALRGHYFDGVVLDEVADMKPEVWTAIILPALADRKGFADFIGTAKGINLFSELYFKALQDDEWSASLHTVYDTDALDPDEIERQRRAMPESQFRQEFLCDFNAGAANTLITVDTATAAMGKHLREDEYSFAPKIIGVDVARQGDDRSVIFRRQGLASFTPKPPMQGANAMEVANAVAFEIHTWQPDAVMVDGTGGYGAGVIDRLRQLGHDVMEVQFGGKAMDPRFLNKRMEMYWNMSEWLQTGGILPDMPALKVELCTPTYSFTTTGAMKLEDKQSIKDRMGFSPDLADALALTFAFPVAPRAMQALGYGVNTGFGHVDRDYDPLSRM